MPLLIKIFFVADLVISLLYILDNILGSPFPFVDLFVRFGQQASLPTWYFAVKLFLLGFLLAIFSQHQFQKNYKESWPLLLASVIFLILSLDQVTRIDHRLIQKFLADGEEKKSIYMAGIWLVICFALFLLGVGAKRYFENRPKVLKKFLIGWVCLLISGTGIESLQNFVRDHEVLQPLKILCHGLVSTVGVTILLWATYDLLISYNIPLIDPKKNS